MNPLNQPASIRPEIAIILKALENKDPVVEAMEKKILALLNDPKADYSFSENIRSEILHTGKNHGDRQPFFYFYSAVVRLIYKDYKEAKKGLMNAVQGFRISGNLLNEALSEWLFGIIHFESEKLIRAIQACETASLLLDSLINECEKDGAYNQAYIYKNYLRKIKEFAEGIDTSKEIAFSDDALENKQKDNKTLEFKDRLRKFHDELEKIIQYLKGRKMKIPPTLVAAKFYSYKMITPSHSVYPPIPDPESEKEKQIYNELIKKVGFFEIIEQLTEQEQEITQTASREELLEKINREWDEDIKKIRET